LTPASRSGTETGNIVNIEIRCREFTPKPGMGDRIDNTTEEENNARIKVKDWK
jgi:hypothetical protein